MRFRLFSLVSLGLFGAVVSANAGLITHISGRMTIVDPSGRVLSDRTCYQDCHLMGDSVLVDGEWFFVDAELELSASAGYGSLYTIANTWQGGLIEFYPYAVGGGSAEAAFSGSVSVWGPPRSGYAQVTAAGLLRSCGMDLGGCSPGGNLTVSVGGSVIANQASPTDPYDFIYSSGLVPVQFGNGSAIPVSADLKAQELAIGIMDREFEEGDLSFTIKLFDENGAPLQNFEYYSPFAIEGGTYASPEPSPAMLIASGGVLAWIASRRRRRTLQPGSRPPYIR